MPTLLHYLPFLTRTAVNIFLDTKYLQQACMMSCS